MNDNTFNSELLEKAIAYKAIQLVEEAKTATLFPENEARFCIAHRYPRVFFDELYAAIEADAKRNPDIKAALIKEYSAHITLPSPPPQNPADKAGMLPDTFGRLSPLMKAGIDLVAHIQKDLLHTINCYTREQLQQLTECRNNLADTLDYEREAVIEHYISKEILAAWKAEMERLPYYRATNVERIIPEPPDNLELLSHWHREAPPPHTPAPPASTGADNVISFADRANKKADRKKGDDDKTR